MVNRFTTLLTATCGVMGSQRVSTGVARQKGDPLFNTRYGNEKEAEIMIDSFSIGRQSSAEPAMPGYGIDGPCFWLYACNEKHHKV